MFETMRGFLDNLMSPGGGRRQFDDNDHRLAAVALLIHVADADGELDAQENSRLRALIQSRFGMDGAETSRLLREARESGHESVSVDHFVKVLNRVLDENARLKLVEMMWDIVYADGAANETEDTIVWRIAEMLEIRDEDRETLRRSRSPGHWPGPPPGSEA